MCMFLSPSLYVWVSLSVCALFWSLSSSLCTSLHVSLSPHCLFSCVSFFCVCSSKKNNCCLVPTVVLSFSLPCLFYLSFSLRCGQAPVALVSRCQNVRKPRTLQMIVLCCIGLLRLHAIEICLSPAAWREGKIEDGFCWWIAFGAIPSPGSGTNSICGPSAFTGRVYSPACLL